MGREIRRVIPNWEHPRKRCEHSPWAAGCDDAKQHGGMCYQPMYDEDYKTASDEWKDGLQKWEATERAEHLVEYGDDYEYWDYNGNPPDKEYYRPAWTPEEATWFQVYQTVSEGSPVTPPFATKEELIDYLARNGDFWDQQRGDGPWSRANAEVFVKDEWAPFLISINGRLYGPKDGIPEDVDNVGS